MYRSFFQSVCVLGYCLFPLVAAAVVAIFVELIWVRLPLAILTFLWSTYGKYTFHFEKGEKKRFLRKSHGVN